MNANLKANEPNLPAVGKVEFNPPKVERVQTKDGTIIYAQTDKTLPIVRVTAMIKTGRVYDPPGKTGLTDLFMTMIRYGGTVKYKPEDINKKLEFLGASIEASAHNEEARLSMYCLSKDFDEVFSIFSDMLTAPSFDDKILSLKKEEAIELIRRRNDEPDRQAIREALRMFFGKDHPYGIRPEKDTIESITYQDLKDYHLKYVKSSNIVIAAAGNIDESDLFAKIKEGLSSLPKGKTEFPAIADVKLPNKRQVYLIDKPISQTSVVILNEGVKRHDDREYPLAVLSEYMGQGIQSKLGREIRSKRGLAYTVYSYFSKRNASGFIQTYFATKPQSCFEGTSEILNQLKMAWEGLIEREAVESAKNQIINSFVFRFPTVFDLVNERASYEFYGYKEGYLDNYVKNIDSISLEDVAKTAKQFYKTDKSLIFVVGDSKKFDKPLSELGPVEQIQED